MEADAPEGTRSPSADGDRAAFAGVFGAVLLGMLAIGATLPVLPRYIHGPIGSGDVAVGVVIGAFAVLAVIGRPIGGHLADATGRRRIVVVGLLLSALAGLMLLIPAGVPGLVAARMVLGLGEGWSYTAAATWVVDLTPAERRGRAIGLFGLAIWGGLAFGPVIGELVYSIGSYESVFVLSAVLPLLGAALAWRMPDHHVPVPREERPRGSLVPPGVAVPGLALALSSLGFGAMSGFLVLHLAERGIGHGALAFAVFAGAVVLARLVGAGLPDRLGPQVTARGAFACEAAGLVLVGLAQSLPIALAGAFVMGAGFSLLFPSLALIVVDRTDDRRRGAAMGAFTAFFDLGVGVGAPLAGAISALGGYDAAFFAAAGAAVLGALLGRARPDHRRAHGPPEPTPA